MYKSQINRPHSDYGDVIFHIPPQNNGIFGNNNANDNRQLNVFMAKIESVQHQATLAISGTWQVLVKLSFTRTLD